MSFRHLADLKERVMNRRSSALCVVLAVLSLLVLTGPVSAGKLVPFHGTLDGVVTVTPEPPPSTLFFVLVEAEGHASHLGAFTVSIPHLVNRADRTAEGSYVFVAANGDELYADFEGQSTPTGTPGVISIEEHATITGGTGRFAHASGSFVCERLYDSIAGTTTGFFEGTISSPGANKK
jgi:hypothetical protein